MQFNRFDSPSDFYDHTKDFLCANEAANNLIIGLAQQVMSPNNPYTEPAYMVSVVVDDEIMAIAFRTPPHKLIFSDIAPEYMDSALDLILADAQLTFGDNIPGTLGPKSVAKMVADKWHDMTGIKTELSLEERIYQLDKVIPVDGVNGRIRPIVESDRETLIQWVKDFIYAIWGINEENAEKRVDRMFTDTPEQSGCFIWENEDKPVSMALYTGPTPNGYRVGWVYTPQEYRKNGYASAVVAGVSQIVLDMGRKHVFLFTDLANPTSNHIYQEIGYRPICDVDDYNFG